MFLWQRSIVTETMAKYLRSHTAKMLKKLCYRLFVNVSLFVLQILQKAEAVCRIQHLYKCQQTSKDFVTFSAPIS